MKRISPYKLLILKERVFIFGLGYGLRKNNQRRSLSLVVPWKASHRCPAVWFEDHTLKHIASSSFLSRAH